MPIYEYACVKCGRHYEVMQKMGDAPLTRCEACRGKLEKQWSQTSMQFKGTGWYVTDYAARKTGTEEKGGEKSKDEKSNTSKTDGGEKSTASDKSAAADKSIANDKSGASETKSDKTKADSSNVEKKPAKNSKS